MSFFDSFFGKQQKRDIEDSSARATGHLTKGFDDARGYGERYNEKAVGYLEPQIGSGRDAERMYRTATGLNGRDQQRGYYDDFQFDPGYQDELSHGVRAIDRSAASRGMVNSGANVNAVADAGRRWASDAHRRRLEDYFRLMGRGDQASSNAAGLTAGLGNSLMEMRSGQGQQLAGNEINLGNAVAGTRNIGLQNMLNIANTASKFIMPNSAPNQYWQPSSGSGSGSTSAPPWSTSVNRLFG